MSTGFRANKRRWLWLMLGWMWVAIVFYLSLMPVPPQPVAFWQADKLEHLLAYCLLMLWFSQVYRKFSARLLMAIQIFYQYTYGDYQNGHQQSGREFSVNL